MSSCSLWLARAAAAPREVVQCWMRVRQRVTAIHKEQEDKRLADMKPVPACAQTKNIPVDLPTIEETAKLLIWLTAVGKKQTMQEEHDRVTAWTRWVNKAWTSKPKELYSWLKKDAQSAVVMPECEDQTMTSNIEEMDDPIHLHWDPIMRKCAYQSEPSIERFMEECAQHIQHHDMQRKARAHPMITTKRDMTLMTAKGVKLGNESR
uniref:Uncharacterized protein n=1 Tax=Eutreptiella gymnastica TaxID=73025 RepID=A0A7S1I183_9EUGL